MEGFCEISKGGRDKFLNKNKTKKQKIVTQTKEKQNVSLIQNLIRTFLCFKSVKRSSFNRQPMQLQARSIKDLNLNLLWILNPLDMQERSFRKYVIEFWCVVQNQMNKKNVLKIHFSLLSRLGVNLIEIIQHFGNQLIEEKNVVFTLVNCFVQYNITVKQGQYQFFLQYLINFHQNCQNLVELIMPNFVSQAKNIQIMKVLKNNIQFFIYALNKLLKLKDFQKINFLLSCFYNNRVNQQQTYGQQTFKKINIDYAVQVYQSVSCIIMNSQQNIFQYVTLLQHVFYILQQIYANKIKEKYASSLYLFSTDKQFQQFFQQKQEWLQLKQILSLQNLQATQFNLQNGFKCQNFFIKIIKLIVFQFQQRFKQNKSTQFGKLIQFATSLMKYIASDIQVQIQMNKIMNLFQILPTQAIYKFANDKIQRNMDQQVSQSTFLFVLTIANKRFLECTDLHFIQQFNNFQKINQLKKIIKEKLLKILTVLLFLQKTPPLIISITRTTIQLLQNLYNKIFRTKIIPTKIFQNESFVQKLRKYDSKSNNFMNAGSVSQQILIFLAKFPFVFPIELRFQRFRKLIRQERNTYLYQLNDDQGTGKVIIRRGYQFIDAFDQLKTYNLKKRLQIVFVNEFGIKQQGVDAGGLSKQFINRVLKSVLNPIYGMFIQNSQKQLFPHPLKAQIKKGIQTQYYQFIGKLLGKAIYQNITLGPKFCGPFLNAIVGKKNSFDDLRKIDSDLYKSLIYIKDMKEDASQLFLTFTYKDQIRKMLIALKSNGHKINVNNENKQQFINLLTNYKVNKSVQYQCRYIRRGLQKIINKEWFNMFNYQQLNYLISGTGIIDVQDMKAFSKISGYNLNDQIIIDFWSVVKQFNEQEKSKLLMFVTACPRPSYLGFKDLSPPFTVVRAMNDNIQSLPISHTCSNILELPNYQNRQVLKQKLKTAIYSNSGFQFG